MTGLMYFLVLMVPIVIIHEYGHYRVGRAFGIEADVFSVGFGPVIFSRTDSRGTNWRFSLIPLGGYVKFRKDENDTSFPSLEANKLTYNASYLGKMLTVAAGPIANFVFSFVLFFAYLTMHGLQTDKLEFSAIHYPPPAEFLAGDKLIEVEGIHVETLTDFYEISSQEPFLEASFQRGNEVVSYEIPNPLLPLVEMVEPGGPADRAGVRKDDVIKAFAGTEIFTRNELRALIQANDGYETSITVDRDGEIIDLMITPEAFDDGVLVKIYFAAIYETSPAPLSIIQALPESLIRVGYILSMSINGISDLIRQEVSIEAMSGPIGIARIATDAADSGLWSFIFMMGIISSAIGFMNLLPLPILDGGHLILMTYERVFGRLPPQKVLNFAFSIGLFVILALMIFTIYNDVTV